MPPKDTTKITPPSTPSLTLNGADIDLLIAIAAQSITKLDLKILMADLNIKKQNSAFQRVKRFQVKLVEAGVKLNDVETGDGAEGAKVEKMKEKVETEVKRYLKCKREIKEGYWGGAVAKMVKDEDGGEGEGAKKVKGEDEDDSDEA